MTGDTKWVRRGGKNVAMAILIHMVKEEIDGTHLHQQSTPPALLIVFINDFNF